MPKKFDGKPPKKKKVTELSKAETRELWEYEEKKKQLEERIAKANDEAGPDSPYIDDRNLIDPEEKDLKDAWQKLIALARVKFPEEHAARFKLKPRQRLVAIAHVYGWSNKQIKTASGLGSSTISTYLNDPLVQEFMAAFHHFLGEADGKSLIDKEIWASIQVLKDLRDDTRTPASVRQSVATWFYEQKYGKSKEVREVKGPGIKDLTEKLMEATAKKGNKVVTPDDEDEWLN
jgi:hypothetical protein